MPENQPVAADVTRLLASIVENLKGMHERLERIEADHEGIKAGLSELDKATAGALVMLKRHDDTLKAITVQPAPSPVKRTLN